MYIHTFIYMSKLLGIIEPMKDAFFVARLHSKEYAEECAIMRLSDVITDNAETERRKLKILADAGIGEAVIPKSSSSNVLKGKDAKGSIGDDSTTVEEGATTAEVEANGFKTTPSDPQLSVEIKDEIKREASIEINGEMNGHLNTDIKEEVTDINLPSSETKETVDAIGTADLKSGADLGENGDIGAPIDSVKEEKEKEDDDKTPKTPQSTTDTPAVNRSSRRVKGRTVSKLGLEPPTPTVESTIDNEDSEIAVPESKEDEADKDVMDIKEESVVETVKEVDAIDVEPIDELPVPVKEETGFLDKDIKNDIIAETSSSSSIKKEENEDLMDFGKGNDEVEKKPALTFAMPGTTKYEIIEGIFLKDDTEDVDDTLESEHFDTRQSFLNLCQGNHYQFDQLRRAKHTSMMVLYHLHNPDAPKFVPNCHSCHRDILVGTKYRCEPCEQDHCTTCYTQYGAKLHHHPLRAMAVTAVAAPPVLSDEQRRQRQQAIDLHLTLLVHASSCVLGSDCKSRHCQKMKVLIPFYFHI
jgi:hypothetical protein